MSRLPTSNTARMQTGGRDVTFYQSVHSTNSVPTHEVPDPNNIDPSSSVQEDATRSPQKVPRRRVKVGKEKSSRRPSARSISTKKKTKPNQGVEIIGWQRNATASSSKTSRTQKEDKTLKMPKDSDTESKPQSKTSKTRQGRRRERQEIIMGWQRNPSAKSVDNPLVNLVKSHTLSKTAVESLVGGKRNEEKYAAESANENHQDMVDTVGGCLPKRIKSKIDDGPKKQEKSPADEGSIKTKLKRQSSRTPAHLRVYSSGVVDRKHDARSRGERRRQKTSSGDNVVLHWSRNPKSRQKEAKVSGSDRVDKEALAEVARRLETQRRYEHEKLETMRTIRGRRYRTNNNTALHRLSRSCSPGTKTKRKEQTAEMQLTWQRQPPTTARSARRMPKGTSTQVGSSREDPY